MDESPPMIPSSRGLHIHVLGAMGGNEEIIPGGEAHPVQDSRLLLCDLAVLVHCIDNRITGHEDLLLIDPFLQQVVARQFRRGEEIIGDMISHNAVDLFRHPPVETPEPCFHVPDRDMEFCRRKRTGKDRIRIALDKNDIRRILFEYLLDTCHDLSGLHGMAAGTDVKIMVWRRQLQFFEKNPVHLIGVMLPGMED